MHHNKKKGLKASQSFDEAVLGGQDEEQLQVHNYIIVLLRFEFHVSHQVLYTLATDVK